MFEILNLKTKDNELVEYNQKGMKHIPTLRISTQLFDLLFDAYTQNKYLVKDIELWNKCGFGLWYKWLIPYYTDNRVDERMILSTIMLTGALRELKEKYKRINAKLYRYINLLLKKIPERSFDYEIIKDPAITDNFILKTTPRQVKSDFKKVAKDLTTKQLQKIVDEVGVNDEERVKPFYNRFCIYDDIRHYTNCVKMDIHKAHSKFIIDTFKEYPKIVKWVEEYNKKSAKAKKAGKLDEAQMYKDYPNLLVGCLGQLNKKTNEPTRWLKDVNTRPLYNRCVNNVFNQITKQIKLITNEESRLLYGQTDGFIMKDPDWSKVIDSKEVGEFGIEQMDNNECWMYRHMTDSETTGYCIYQYYENGRKKVVGDLPDVLKEKIDLSKGIIVSYKEIKDEYRHSHYINVKEINLWQEKE